MAGHCQKDYQIQGLQGGHEPQDPQGGHYKSPSTTRQKDSRLVHPVAVLKKSKSHGGPGAGRNNRCQITGEKVNLVTNLCDVGPIFIHSSSSDANKLIL
jgi:hypothetical protein